MRKQQPCMFAFEGSNGNGIGQVVIVLRHRLHACLGCFADSLENDAVRESVANIDALRTRLLVVSVHVL